ncbi:hypothetical protein [Vibrio algarum]|uniref:DUF2798 domain-containing protein n=1 Tax=Vibrio algarum TaxID=3020714 RepID=A0ABT4YW09_9VIBR|nr:hypothetical protein [Vibrio sp. KJ40-1]MDB1125772.1 hypothetical protein [Vibrio sp. KJ40-1]
MRTLFNTLLFSVLMNTFVGGSIFLISTQTDFISVNFISDYFFYSVVIQWVVGVFFMVSTPTTARYINHSPNIATRKAASISDSSGEQAFTYVDLPLSQRLFISGTVSLLICLII